MTPGRATYGQTVGIVMQPDRILRMPGDVGNATTFPFPVLYEVVHGAEAAHLKRPDLARAAAPRYIAAARSMEAAGVRLIGTGCGYLSILHRELQAAVAIPVFSSSLMQVPWVARALPPGQRVGIITADSQALTEAYFEPLGWSSREVAVAIRGIEGEREFLQLLYADRLEEADVQRMHRAMAQVAHQFRDAHPEVGAIVLECTNLPPFAATIQRAAGVAVFDVTTLLTWAHAAAVRHAFTGYL